MADREAEAPLARSQAEADLYLSLQPCPRCGEIGRVVEGYSFGEVEGVPVRWLTTRCPNCGEVAEHAFRFPREPAVPVDGHQRFGGDSPSHLLDPGQWLLLAEGMLADVPESPDELSAQRRRELREQIDVAVAAIEEALKFIREGADAVSPFAFWSEAGYGLFSDAPHLFERESMEFDLATHRQLLDRYTD